MSSVEVAAAAVLHTGCTEEVELPDRVDRLGIGLTVLLGIQMEVLLGIQMEVRLGNQMEVRLGAAVPMLHYSDFGSNHTL